MTIKHIRFRPLSVRLRKPFVISLGPLTHADNVIVTVETDDGRIGWGEASPFPTIHGETVAGCLAVGEFLATPLIGHPVTDIAGLHATMDRTIYGNNCIKSAIDMAVYDLNARAAGLPLYAYLGGRNDKEIRTDYTVSLGSKEEMALAAADVRRAGFPVIKIKLGGGGAEDVLRMQAIQAAVGTEIPLRLDANQGWSFPEAKRTLRTLAEKFPNGQIQHCEAPLDKRDWIELPRLRAASPIPLMADEACCDHEDARRLLEASAVDRINIKLSKSGGFFKALKIIERAEKYGVPLQIGGFLESRLGFTAAAHLALTSELVRYYDFDTPLMQEEDLVTGGITYGKGGLITVAARPGLGARLTNH